MIDLRSVTVTHPTPEMRAAMVNAEVGENTWRDYRGVDILKFDAEGLLATGGQEITGQVPQQGGAPTDERHVATVAIDGREVGVLQIVEGHPSTSGKTMVRGYEKWVESLDGEEFTITLTITTARPRSTATRRRRGR